MKKFLIAAVVVAAVFQAAPVQAAPKFSCAGYMFATAAATAEERQQEPLASYDLYHFVSGAWRPFDPQSHVDARPRSLILLYVVRTGSTSDRSGALNIKTALRTKSQNASSPLEPVRLIRNWSAGDHPRCKRPARHNNASVSLQVYQQYHDLQLSDAVDVSTSSALKTFHFEYALPGDTVECRSTEDKTYRSVLTSNRTQFSFNSDVVRWGAITAWGGSLVQALAPSSFIERQIATNYLQYRSELKYYRTQGGSACVPFRLPDHTAAHLLRVNDLAAIGLAGIRASERTWQNESNF